MRPVLPAHVLDIHEPKVNLVDQGRCLEGVTGLFGGHIALGEAVQLVVDERHQLLERFFVPGPPRLKQLGYMVR